MGDSGWYTHEGGLTRGVDFKCVLFVADREYDLALKQDPHFSVRVTMQRRPGATRLAVYDESRP